MEEDDDEASKDNDEVVGLAMTDRAEEDAHNVAARLLPQQAQWIEEQEHLKRSLVQRDHFLWKYVPGNDIISTVSGDKHVEDNSLHYVGGVDLSFCKEDPSLACGALIVLEMPRLKVVYKDFDIVHLDLPYIPGFLAFRESPVLLELLRKMRMHKPALFPQLLMVDGNGILHPRGFGLASHLGVLADIPTIGIGKNLHHVDGLNDIVVKVLASKYLKKAGDAIDLIGKSGKVLGAALKSKDDCKKPVFVSIGHRISLDSAIDIVRACCMYRLPEPADIESKEYLRKML
ncbi:hypothetical protein O6H91_17G007300 [Diphasiastrum complanatum]|uniref:Uncharacterized protein n=1 Tax=Diphasiastrum complanatum TaxID=34168 RepID=A0ACC2B540_DIPCM|nr:hypothetical protein O6H91_17G007300 [Diphasiastrum complanatum]